MSVVAKSFSVFDIMAAIGMAKPTLEVSNFCTELCPTGEIKIKAPKIQEVNLLPQSHLLDGPHVRIVRKGVEMNKPLCSFRQVLKIIKLVLDVISVIIKIIRDLNSF